MFINYPLKDLKPAKIIGGKKKKSGRRPGPTYHPRVSDHFSGTPLGHTATYQACNSFFFCSDSICFTVLDKFSDHVS